MLERLATYLIARQQAGDHARIAFAAALKQGQRAVAVTEKPEHRRHAVMGIAQHMRRFFAHRAEAFHHTDDVTIGIQQRLGRTADMAAIRQDLSLDLVFQAPQAAFAAFRTVIQA